MNRLRQRIDAVAAAAVPDATSLRVLRLLGAQSDRSQRELAQAVGVSLGRANYCLRALIAKGFVRTRRYRTGANRLAYRYLLTVAGVAAREELTRRLLARRMTEYDALRREIEDLERENQVVAART